MVGKEDPLTPGKGERKEEGRRRGCLLKGVYGWGGAGGRGGGSGNRKETEARDMKSKARSWGSPTLRRGRDWEGISPAILVTCKGTGGNGDVK
jgi:hypothetical protein